MDCLYYDLNKVPESIADESLLDAFEREQYTSRGLRYLIIRSLLKTEVARRLGMCPHDIRFNISEHGKPEFPGIHFNISHSGDSLLMAFHHSPVGADLERIRPHRSMDRLARRIMCPEQYERFVSHGAQTDEFFACWCAAEALVKQAADTIWHAADYPFIYKSGRIIPTFDGAPQVTIFHPAPHIIAAVACHS